MTTMIHRNRCQTSFLKLVVPGRSRIPNPASLMEAIESVVQQIPEAELCVVVCACRTLALHPRVVLGALAYCYARQIYAASEILDVLVRDDAFAKVCQGDFPNVRELEAFRRQNRAALEKCLVAALQFLAGRNIASGLVTRSSETIIAEEAKRRIIMAACLNSLELGYENQPWIAQ